MTRLQTTNPSPRYRRQIRETSLHQAAYETPNEPPLPLEELEAYPPE